MQFSPTRYALTMIELLCVVTIIALLVAMLMPLAGMVRESARQVLCASNLRQVGLLQLSYATNHAGTVPPAYLRPNMYWLAPGAVGYGNVETAIYGVHGRVWGDCWEAWYQWLGKELGSGYKNQWNENESFVNYLTCPAAPHRPPTGQAMANTTHIYGGNSYGLNTAVLGDTGVTGANQWGFPNQSQSITGWPGYGVGIPGLTDNRRKLARISHPGDTILVAEHLGADHWLLGNTDNPFAYWSEAPFVRPPVDNRGVELTPPAGWGTWLPAFGWRDTYARSLAVRVAHRGRSNYLFHDGHVAALTPWETSGPDPAQPNMWTGNAP